MSSKVEERRWEERDSLRRLGMLGSGVVWKDLARVGRGECKRERSIQGEKRRPSEAASPPAITATAQDARKAAPTTSNRTQKAD